MAKKRKTKARKKTKLRRKETKASKKKKAQASHEGEDRGVVKIKRKTLHGLVVGVSVLVAILIFSFAGSLDGTGGTGGVQQGSIVTVNYVGRLDDGSVFDTSYEEVARAEGTYTELRKYGPLEFTVGRGEMIAGFEKAVIGMKEGEEKTVTIPAADAYGQVDPTKVVPTPIRRVPRTLILTSSIEVPAEQFSQVFGKEAIIGDKVSQEPFEYLISSVTEDIVYIEYVVEEGQIIKFPQMDWESTVVEIGDEIKVRHDPVEGQVVNTVLGDGVISTTEEEIIVTVDPEVGMEIITPMGVAKVAEVGAKEIMLDLNHPLAGKDLTFTIKVEKLMKREFSKPIVKMFVMSYCPYGQITVDYFKPVVELMGDKVSVEPHFVIYDPSTYAGREGQYCIGEVCSLHGIPELREDMRQACIFRDQPDVWWDYAKCTIDECSLGQIETCWKTCADKTGVNIAAVEGCVEADGLALMAADKELNAKYGVTGSPSVFINDEPYEGARNSDALKSELCTYFETQPIECGQTIATTGAATAAAGTCG